MAKGWVDHLRAAIRERWAVGEFFSLDDVYRLEGHFSHLYPRNRHVRDKFRETLQFLRNQGFVEFVDNHGMYRRVGE
jgi:type II restriction enzyme